ncbi:hypothetical protein RRG08_037988 [Elysia crispata]|uniref:Uncharacterized protein n=1 Tax=Elysia crispata TaxID=231223 RepID=A0AAE1ADG3_9GAST|nr:hypothetical protein RRG08_037988 [Elysia crispata]
MHHILGRTRLDKTGQLVPEIWYLISSKTVRAGTMKAWYKLVETIWVGGHSEAWVEHKPGEADCRDGANWSCSLGIDINPQLMSVPPLRNPLSSPGRPSGISPTTANIKPSPQRQDSEVTSSNITRPMALVLCYDFTPRAVTKPIRACALTALLICAKSHYRAVVQLKAFNACVGLWRALPSSILRGLPTIIITHQVLDQAGGDISPELVAGCAKNSWLPLTHTGLEWILLCSCRRFLIRISDFVLNPVPHTLGYWVWVAPLSVSVTAGSGELGTQVSREGKGCGGARLAHWSVTSNKSHSSDRHQDKNHVVTPEASEVATPSAGQLDVICGCLQIVAVSKWISSSMEITSRGGRTALLLDQHFGC